MRLIVGQTENAKTAAKLQQSLFDLSKRMEKEHKFDSPEGHHLAFEVTTIAMGIFTKPQDPPKPEWTELPPEVLQVIFSKNPPKNSRRSELEESSDVSKEWKVNAEIVSKDWIDQEVIPLSNYGCKTAEEAVQYVIDNNLPSANLKDFDLTNDQLTKLIENCPRIVHLILNGGRHIREFPLEKLTHLKTLSLLWCTKISQRVLSTGLKKLCQLTSLNLSYCFQFKEKGLPGNELVDGLKNLLQLTYLNLSYCYQIPGERLIETVKNLSQLTYLNLSYCKQIPGEGLVEALKNLSQLTHLSLSDCDQIPGKTLAEILKNFPKLVHLDLSVCSFEGDELAEALQNLSQLTYLDLSHGDKITEVQLDQVLKNLPQLKTLNLIFCSQISDERVDEWRKLYPDLKFILMSDL